MGLSNPLKGTLHLHKCLWAMHIHSHLESCKLAFMYNLLVLAQPLHQFPAQQVLWAALTMAHFGLLWRGKFMVDQECFDPTWHLCIQDVTPTFLPSQSYNTLPSILRSARQTPSDRVLMWSLVAPTPRSAGPVQHGTLYSHIWWNRPPQQHCSSS